MIRAVANLLLTLAFLGSAAIAQDQTGQVPIQFRLTSSINAKIDYYRSQPGGSPTFVGSVEPGATVEMESRQGQVWLFAVNRVPFQQYTVRGEKFQHLTLAPKASSARRGSPTNIRAVPTRSSRPRRWAPLTRATSRPGRRMPAG